ncbi:MAG TPA: cyclic nucleotide-binding domain-containing protein, partial [Chthoniobacterales bacterium]|nr:cyclic nucleotide-binding domain-containing protein [Chthoniobacterales bacterium]
MHEPPLRRVPLFASLPNEELERLGAMLRQLELPANTLVFREGDAGNTVLIILDGQLEVINAHGTADERLLALRWAGEFVGEMSLLNAEGRRTASVRACTAARLVELTRVDFDGLLRRHPAVAYDLARVLSSHVQAANTATIRDLQQKNSQLAQAYAELQAAHVQIVEKEALERELDVARQIQQSMLPRTMPRVAGFDFGALMVPARSVGGDFFDFIALGPDTIGVVIGDVSGKGVPAALFMALTRSLMRAEAGRAGSPAEALRNVNRHLLDMNDA